MKIDFVLPWVDPDDKKWQEKRSEFSGNYNKMANSDARFRDFDTLKFVFRSIEKNCPWFNKIYLITEGHRPKWLNDNPKVEVITHQELYFNKDDLPVFNSSSIEMNLPNIKGLSERFVYLNDDMIFYNFLSKERFFKHDKPVDFFSTSLIKRGRLFRFLKGEKIWVDSLNNNLDLINKSKEIKKLRNEYLYDDSYGFIDKLNNFISKNILGKVLWFGHWHHPQPYLKSTLVDVYDKFSEQMSISSRNKFRKSNDYTHYIFRYWHLMSGEFYPEKNNDGYIKNICSVEDANETVKYLTDNQKVNFLCLNDDENLDSKDEVEIFSIINGFLENKFPEKSSFERDS